MRSALTRIALACAALLVLTAAPVAAQTHPCDAAAEVNPKITGLVHKVGFCHGQKDTDGNTTTITGAQLTVDAAAPVAIAATLITPTPNAGGLYYFETAPVTFTKANHTIKVAATGPGGTSSAAGPFAFEIVDGIPAQPTSLRIVR